MCSSPMNFTDPTDQASLGLPVERRHMEQWQT
jgi:hypothetical protein